MLARSDVDKGCAFVLLASSVPEKVDRARRWERPYEPYFAPHAHRRSVDSLWRELRLRTTVSACVFNVSQRVTRLPSKCRVLSVSSPSPSFNRRVSENYDWFS